jgi:hypothetical protein
MRRFGQGEGLGFEFTGYGPAPSLAFAAGYAVAGALGEGERVARGGLASDDCGREGAFASFPSAAARQLDAGSGLDLGLRPGWGRSTFHPGPRYAVVAAYFPGGMIMSGLIGGDFVGPDLIEFRIEHG